MIKGSHMTIESKIKMSISRKKLPSNFAGKHHTEETKMLISLKQTGIKNHNYGKPMTEEQKLKIKIANTGKKQSKEVIERTRQTRLLNNLLLTSDELSKKYGSRKGIKQSNNEKIKRSNSLKKYYQEHPEALETKRLLMINRYSSIESRIEHGLKMKKILSDPKIKLKKSISIKKVIENNPTIMQNTHEGCKIFHKENPEFIKISLKNGFKGYKHSEESKKKMSLKKLREKSIFWKGGKSIEYPQEWNNLFKEQIRLRDNYTCQLCKSTQSKQKLCVHHIDYDKFNLNFNNLISLCRSCHQKTNINTDYWIKYFLKIQENNSEIGDNTCAKKDVNTG